MNRSALRTIEILEIISAHEDGVALSQIVKLTGMPKTSAYDILKSLESCQAIYRREGSEPNYSIGFRTYAIGNTYKKTSHFLTNANIPTTDLVDKLQKTVILGKYYDDKVLIIDKKEPQVPVVVTPAIGETMEIEQSAMGIVLKECFNKDGSILSKKNDVQRQIIEKGYLVKGIEEDDVIYSIASPIFNFERKMVGVVGILCFNHGQIDIDYEGKQINQCATIISKNMGMNFCLNRN